MNQEAESIENRGRVRVAIEEAGLGFLEEDSDGRAGRHFWLRFDQPIPADLALRLGRHLVRGATGSHIDLFPNGTPRAGLAFPGGLLRLPGKHHKKKHWSRFYCEGRYLEGDEAVQAVLSMPANSVELISKVLTEERDGPDVEQEQDGETSQGKCTYVVKRADKGMEANPRHVVGFRSPPSVNFDDETWSQINEAIASTAPTGVGRRNRGVFEFARWLKGLPGTCDCSPQMLRTVVERWHATHIEVIGTKEFEVTWGDFIRAFHSVHTPRKADLLPLVFATPLEHGVERLASNLGYTETWMPRLITASIRLADIHPDGVFFLACRSAGEQLGCSHEVASNLMLVLVTDKVLKLVGRGRPPRKASRYAIHPDFRLALGASDDYS